MYQCRNTTGAGKVITIMADFGNGPYAWLKEDSDARSGVGVNIADALCGFGGMFPVSAELETDFAEWVVFFERCHDLPAFDWSEFHVRGMALALRLNHELGGTFRVVYDKPFEDPFHAADGRGNPI
jgi:hypothetical protein